MKLKTEEITTPEESPINEPEKLTSTAENEKPPETTEVSDSLENEGKTGITEMTDTPSQNPINNPQPLDKDLFLGENQKSSKKGLLLGVVLVALAVALVTGGIMVYRRTMNSQATISGTGSPDVVEEAPVPEVTEAPELDRAELKIRILNGSGTPGFAGKAKEYLESLGYEGIETANADSYDYDETEISIKGDREIFLDMLKADMVEKYVVAAKTTSLDEDNEYDVVIILGSEEASGGELEEEEEAVTPTPKKEATPTLEKKVTPTPEEEESPTPTPEE